MCYFGIIVRESALRRYLGITETETSTFSCECNNDDNINIQYCGKCGKRFEEYITTEYHGDPKYIDREGLKEQFSLIKRVKRRAMSDLEIDFNVQWIDDDTYIMDIIHFKDYQYRDVSRISSHIKYERDVMETILEIMNDIDKDSAFKCKFDEYHPLDDNKYQVYFKMYIYSTYFDVINLENVHRKYESSCKCCEGFKKEQYCTNCGKMILDDKIIEIDGFSIKETPQGDCHIYYDNKSLQRFVDLMKRLRVNYVKWDIEDRRYG